MENIEITKRVLALLGKPETLIRKVADRPGHDRRYAIDAGKIERTLSWRPEHDFPSGLRRTVEWYLDHPRWVQRVSSGAYQRERLGMIER